jgi:hypothetical protein
MNTINFKSLDTMFFVVAYGRDCDGFNSGHLYNFTDRSEAEELVHACNEGSDGLQYAVVDYNEALRYAKDYGKENLFYELVNGDYTDPEEISGL